MEIMLKTTHNGTCIYVLFVRVYNLCTFGVTLNSGRKSGCGEIILRCIKHF